MGKEHKLYRYNDKILFRKCHLSESEQLEFGDCTNFNTREIKWQEYYSCHQYRIHFHCAEHPGIEFRTLTDYGSTRLYCPHCGEEIEIGDLRKLEMDCLKLLNMVIFKDATLIRLDDWYVPEIKEKIKTDSEYWITTNVKKDKDGDTFVVLYVGHKGEREKAQYFIKPEKQQLTSDHKDMDPSKVISKIEVVLKDRTLTHKYDK